MTDRDTTWTELRACENPTVFYPDEKGLYPFKNEAVATCVRCPVQAQCLDHSLDQEEWIGVWGGFTDRPRRHFGRKNTPNVVRSLFGTQITTFVEARFAESTV